MVYSSLNLMCFKGITHVYQTEQNPFSGVQIR